MDPLPFFVYGTLLPDQPNAGLLLPSARRTRVAVFPDGRLMDMGPFPMLLEGGGGPVRGLLVDVRPEAYAAVLRRLDRLEQYDPDAPDDSPYVRAARSVVVGNRPGAPGQPVRAWVYLGREALAAGRPRIASGSWAEHAAGRLARVRRWWDNFPGLFPASNAPESLDNHGSPGQTPAQEDESE